MKYWNKMNITFKYWNKNQYYNEILESARILAIGYIENMIFPFQYQLLYYTLCLKTNSHLKSNMRLRKVLKPFLSPLTYVHHHNLVEFTINNPSPLYKKRSSTVLINWIQVNTKDTAPVSRRQHHICFVF